MELSPEDIRKDKDKIIPADFIVYIHFEDHCNKCSPYETEIEDLCQDCVQIIGQDTLNEWRAVKKIMTDHDFPSRDIAHKMLPNVDPNLMQTTLATQLKFNPNYYRIHSPQEIEEAEAATLAITEEEESKQFTTQRRLT